MNGSTSGGWNHSMKQSRTTRCSCGSECSAPVYWVPCYCWMEGYPWRLQVQGYGRLTSSKEGLEWVSSLDRSPLCNMENNLIISNQPAYGIVNLLLYKGLINQCNNKEAKRHSHHRCSPPETRRHHNTYWISPVCEHRSLIIEWCSTLRNIRILNH